MAKSCKEGAAAKQRRSGLEGHRFETRHLQGLFTASPPLSHPPSLVICLHKNQFITQMYWLTVHLFYKQEMAHEIIK